MGTQPYRYEAIFSLGHNCQVAAQLKRNGLRRQAGPWDWFNFASTADFCGVIRRRLEGFMQLEHLEIYGKSVNTYYVRDRQSTCLSFHDFKIHPTSRRYTTMPNFGNGWIEGSHGLMIALHPAKAFFSCGSFSISMMPKPSMPRSMKRMPIPIFQCCLFFMEKTRTWWSCLRSLKMPGLFASRKAGRGKAMRKHGQRFCQRFVSLKLFKGLTHRCD